MCVEAFGWAYISTLASWSTIHYSSEHTIMAINRAVITQQLLTQLQAGLTDSAEVSLLRLPDSPQALPQVLIQLGGETVVVKDDFARPRDARPPHTGRKLLFSVQTQVSPTTESALMLLLDTLAENVELALANRDEASLWLCILGLRTDFEFTASAEGLAATMVQSFEMTYRVIREEICLAPDVTEVYLSTMGGPHELVASAPVE
ncbi:MAG: hypothetical protein ACI8WB_003118 [Phenylobacterium sp.]|jgi:hypothetical protein